MKKVLFLLFLCVNYVLAQENPPQLKLQKSALVTPSNEDMAIVLQPLILGEGYGYAATENAQGMVQIVAPLTDRMFDIEGTILRFSGGVQESIKFHINAYGYSSGSVPALNFGANPPKAYWEKQLKDLENTPVTVGNIVENSIRKVVVTIGSNSTIWGKYFNIIIDKVYITNNGIPTEIVNPLNWQISKVGQVNSVDNYSTSFINQSSFGYVSPTGTTSTSMSTATGDLANLEVTNSVIDGNQARPAFMQFHRKGQYAAYFGLDNDNQFKVGGWSMGNTAYKLWHEGNFNPNNKSNNDEVVKLFGDQSIGGVKTFNSIIVNSIYDNELGDKLQVTGNTSIYGNLRAQIGEFQNGLYTTTLGVWDGFLTLGEGVPLYSNYYGENYFNGTIKAADPTTIDHLTTKRYVDNSLVNKANDLDVLHKSGNEVSSGNKIFNDFIGIGSPYISGFKLAVNGNIKSKTVTVDPNNWPDYVFDSTYKLPDLESTAKYIKEYKHLPEVPSAREVEEKGHDLGAMNTLLLKKIEELTLYLIQQEKRIADLEKKN